MSAPHPAKLEPGITGAYERVVSPEMTLSHANSEWPAVFSTPAMIAMMEMACSDAVRGVLPPGSLTVGIRIEVDHVKPLPAGETVIASARLAEIHGRRLVFEVTARSGEETLGHGRIFHAIVEHARFESRAAAKRSSR